MKIVAIYNMKGGVGKSTTAVNLSYLSAASGRRTLIWDLDPQAAASFAFRVRPHVAGFGKKALAHAHVLSEAIKETDYPNLDLLPADFGYRKLERMLDRAAKPERTLAALLSRLGDDYDVMFLDCPAGFSLLTEGIFAAADAVLVPTIPTVLSLRMVARLIKWATRAESPGDLVAFFNMVDRRKSLHRRACEWSLGHPELFLARHVPYASVVEQMTVRRTPLPVFAARDAATAAFAEISAALQTRLQGKRAASRQRCGEATLGDIERIISQLESAESGSPRPAASETFRESSDAVIVHRFDTDRRDLERMAYLLELSERGTRFVVTARQAGRADAAGCVHAEIDRAWALEILTGAMSPLDALEKRLGQPGPILVQHVRAIVGGRALERVGSQNAEDALIPGDPPPRCVSPLSATRADRVIAFDAPARRHAAGG